MGNRTLHVRAGRKDRIFRTLCRIARSRPQAASETDARAGDYRSTRAAEHGGPPQSTFKWRKTREKTMVGMDSYARSWNDSAAFAGEGPVKIGVLGDSSSVYANIGGKGSVEAVKMAVEDAGPVLGAPVEVVSADHQNKADVGSNIARRWFDVEGVDVIADLPNSAVALAVIEVARDKHKITLTAPDRPTLPDNIARRTPHNGFTTAMRLAKFWGQASPRAGVTAGSSSRSTTHSVTRSSVTPPSSSRRRAARCWAACVRRSIRRTSPRSSSRRRLRAPR